MVLTRSQAAKNKANQSPEPVALKLKKQPRKQQPAAAPGGGEEQPQAEQAEARQGLRKSLGAMGLRLSSLKGPASHPIDSLPASPAAGAGSPPLDFTIPAAVQQAAQPEAAGGAAGAQPEQQAQQQQQLEQREASPEAIAVEAQRPPAAAPAGLAGQQQRQEEPPPQPKPEKLLKPLPDKPVACDKLPDGPEPVVVDVEYVARGDLQPVEDPAAALAAAVPGLGAADWTETVKALNLVRQLAAHHPDACASQLDTLVPLVLKSVRSLRSSVCKTAIMAVADLYQTYGDALLPHTDVGGQAKPLTSLLHQVLLKCSSNDKKFVIEEAQRALQVMVASLSPADSLQLLLPYADQHKNPKVRGKAGGAAAEAVARMAPTEVAAFGLPCLLGVAGKLVTDNTPDARDSAKRIIGLLKAAFADPAVEAQLGVQSPPPAPAPAEGEEAARPPTKWEAYCQANLSGSAALAVLKASAE